MIYAYLDKNIKATNVKELVQNQTVSFSGLENTIVPYNAECVVVHGVLRGMNTVIKQAIHREIPWVCMDNGYLGKYKRVLLNSTAPTTLRQGKRFEHGTQLLPWRGGTGDKILVLPPSPPYMDTFDLRDFLNFIAHNVNKYTDKDIIVRGKPAKGRKARPLLEQIKEAYCVITWGSAAALEAMKYGVPTISLGWCPAKLASKSIEDLETEKMKEEPDRMTVFDNLTWSSFEREELPEAWDIVMENSKCRQI
tara:strand:+ start:57 stop:809 length:753 start_codon:yes stop_codon:yes gene_type:complete